MPHVSNVTGVVNAISEIVAQAHAHNVPVLVDGAQAAGHLPVDVQALGCDLYVFSEPFAHQGQWRRRDRTQAARMRRTLPAALIVPPAM